MRLRFQVFIFQKLNIMTTILSVIGVSIGQWLGFTLRILPDKNFRDIHGLVRIFAEQVSEQTRDNKENYKSIEHVTAASQENAAGIREIEKMVR